jgi:MFS family permease
LIGVLLGIYLAKLHFDPKQVGLLVTLAGDRLGRRFALVLLAVIGTGGSIVAAFSTHLLVICAAAFVGMLNGMGRDRGASLVLDQAILPATGGEEKRTLGFAWYSLMQDVGHGLGALLAFLPSVFQRLFAVEELTSFRFTLVVHGLLILSTAALYLGLSPAAEAPRRAEQVEISPQSRKVVFRISGLFLIDALGGGFLTASVVSYFFFERFGVSEGGVGLLFFGARVMNAGSHLGAAWLAKRIGLVKTMVWTHMPSSLLLMTVAFAPNFPIAAILFLIREGLVEMDVPTRQSYVMAVVRPEERTFAAGVTSLVRLGGWAIAPAFAGLLMQGTSLAAPLFVGSSLKISYDVLLWLGFRARKPPEEAAGPVT